MSTRGKGLKDFNRTGIIEDSNGTLSMWIDDFPEYAVEDSGYDNMEDFLSDAYFGSDMWDYDGNRFNLCDETLEFEGSTYSIWVCEDWSMNCQFKYILTDTDSFQDLTEMSVEYDYDNVYRPSPIRGFLGEDLAEVYSANDRDDVIVRVIEL